MVCPVRCVARDPGSDACSTPTCAAGPNHDMCPADCVPQPIA
jgi:hypothetical protein